jgi:hypothetical protein
MVDSLSVPGGWRGSRSGTAFTSADWARSRSTCCDSRRAVSSRLLQAARQWGLIPQRVGTHGRQIDPAAAGARRSAGGA